MTSVLGHLTGAEFPPQYRKWQGCRPIDLFDAPVLVGVDPVRSFPTPGFLCLISLGTRGHREEYNKTS